VRSSSSPQPTRTVDLHLTGQQADDYVAEKALHDPEFARFLSETEKTFKARGWTKLPGANMALIRRVERREPGVFAKLRAYLMGPVQAEEMGTATGGGEILMSAWDDGNWNTYEGAIWVKDYNIGDTFWFEHNFDYSASQDEWTLPTVTYTGPVSWRDRDGRERPGRQGRSTDPAQGFIAKVTDAVCPTLGAQASDHLSCSANPRSLVNAFMKQGFIRLRENAGWLLGGAAAGEWAAVLLGSLAG
jgi:hypothetical protein